MNLFSIDNVHVPEFEQFLDSFNLTENVIDVQEYDWRTHYQFIDLNDQEISWIELEIENLKFG